MGQGWSWGGGEEWGVLVYMCVGGLVCIGCVWMGHVGVGVGVGLSILHV